MQIKASSWICTRQRCVNVRNECTKHAGNAVNVHKNHIYKYKHMNMQENAENIQIKTNAWLGTLQNCVNVRNEWTKYSSNAVDFFLHKLYIKV